MCVWVGVCVWDGEGGNVWDGEGGNVWDGEGGNVGDGGEKACFLS